MAANIITFESEYMRECAKNAENAKRLVEEARTSLKRANRHDGWRCPERSTINNSLSDLSTRIDRIIKGLNETASALTKGAGQFSDLESRAQNEEIRVYNQLKKTWAFEATKWDGSQTTLPTTSIPDYLKQRAEFLINKMKDPVFLARMITHLVGTVGGFALFGLADCAITVAGAVLTPLDMLFELANVVYKVAPSIPSGNREEIARSLLLAASKAGLSISLGELVEELSKSSAFSAALLGAFSASGAAFDGSTKGAEFLLGIFETFFGKDPDGLIDSGSVYRNTMADYL